MVQRSAAMLQLSQFHMTVTVDHHSISITFDRHYSSRIFTVSETKRFQIHYSCHNCSRYLNSGMVQRSAAMHQLSQFHMTVTVDHHSISSTFDKHHSSRIITVSEPTRFQIHYSCRSCSIYLNSLAWYSVRRPCISCHSFT